MAINWVVLMVGSIFESHLDLGREQQMRYKQLEVNSQGVRTAHMESNHRTIDTVVWEHWNDPSAGIWKVLKTRGYSNLSPQVLS